MSGLQIAFRAAARKDIKAISAIFEAGLNRTHEFANVTAYVREQINDATIETTVATDKGGRIAGFMMVNLDTGDAAITVDQLAVDSAFRNKGIATALLKHAEDLALKKQFDAVTLYVRADNDNARRLYEGLGYKRLRWQSVYYRDGMAGHKLKKSLLPERPSTWMPAFLRRWAGMTA